MKYYATLCENKEVSNQKVLESVSCLLNFREDRVEFTFKARIAFTSNKFLNL